MTLTNGAANSTNGDIANGATGGDAIEVENKIAVALEFTTRTTASGPGKSFPLPAALVTAARNVLSGKTSEGHQTEHGSTGAVLDTFRPRLK